jgi:nitrogen regulatory protein PII-like uncharacterized protein
MAAQHLYSVCVAAHMLNCKPDDVIRLINRGVLEADSSSTDICTVISEEEVEKARRALKEKGESQ